MAPALSGSGSGLVKNQEFSACRCMITTVHKDHMPSHPHIKVKLMTYLSILQPQANPYLLVRPHILMPGPFHLCILVIL